jgi:hypothetical protein
VAPNFLRKRVYRLIDVEEARARRGEPAALFFKMNALEDRKMIRRLYRASQAGVRIRLMVRGICRLVPGIPGVSDTIEVRSIVGRYLEHARCYWFFNGGEPRLFLGSADLMRRNLNRRVEVLFPILDTALRREIQTYLQLQWADNQQARVLDNTGENRYVRPGPDDPEVDSQAAWYAHLAGTQALPGLEPLVEWPPRETPLPANWLDAEPAPLAPSGDGAGPAPPPVETPAPPPPSAAPPPRAAPDLPSPHAPVPDHLPRAVAVADATPPNPALIDDIVPKWLRGPVGVLGFIGALALLFVLPLLASQCGGSSDPEASALASADTSAALASAPIGRPQRYDLSAPDRVLELDGRLSEISGITLLPGGILGAVQDEEGDLFGLDPRTGAILWERRFGSRGDYEDLALLDSTVYVLRSDGDLFELDDWTADETESTKHENRLKSGCDAEGLTVIPGTRSLLIACKEDAGEDRDGVRALYRFDTATRTVEAEPAYLLNRDAIGALLRGGYERDLIARLGKTFNLNAFKPSGLAYHPRDGSLYVLASRPPSVAVFEPSGALRGAAVLPDLLPQPEGIAFLPDGTMLITTEAAGSVARLLHFAPQR